MTQSIPKHIAIIMDGNGRWARRRGLPRIAGHKAGAETVRKIITACRKKAIQALTLFAFSTDNWNRPKEEVTYLMDAFYDHLQKNVEEFLSNNIKFQVIGNKSEFSEKLRQEIFRVETLTAKNDGLHLTLATNYSGRWDIIQAVQKIAHQITNNQLTIENIDNKLFQQNLCLSDLPEPDLFIRTSGELRLSNFMLWQLAYTELYFTEVLWPEFTEAELDNALQTFAKRERRFGKI